MCTQTLHFPLSLKHVHLISFQKYSRTVRGPPYLSSEILPYSQTCPPAMINGSKRPLTTPEKDCVQCFGEILQVCLVCINPLWWFKPFTQEVEQCSIAMACRIPENHNSSQICQPWLKRKGVAQIFHSNHALMFTHLAAYQICSLPLQSCN